MKRDLNLAPRERRVSPNFITEIIDDDLRQRRYAKLRCTYDADTLGRPPAGGAVKGTIHWVAAAHAVPVEVRLYDRLFSAPDPEAGEGEFTDQLNPRSLAIGEGFVEPSVAGDSPDTRYQFERLGYFWPDPVDSSPAHPIFNRIVTLRDSWTRTDELAEWQRLILFGLLLVLRGAEPNRPAVR